MRTERPAGTRKGAILARLIASVASMASVALALILVIALTTHQGERFWDSPFLGVAGGVVMAAALLMSVALAVRSWRTRLSAAPAVLVAILLFGVTVLGGFLVLSSTSTVYTPLVEIIDD